MHSCLARFLGLVAILFVLGMPAQALPAAVFNTDASFLAAAGGGLTSEGFETAVLGTPTSVTFPGGTFSCSGISFCPGFFGVSTSFHDAGNQSVFFATPDTATFTFGSSINAFGVAIGGAGDVAPITLTASLSNGDTAPVLTNHTGPFTVFESGDRQFFGVIDTAPFTSLTFTGSNSGDGIFFDTMSFGTAGAAPAPVPEPGTLLLFASSGLLGVSSAAWKRWTRQT
jgi:PEP-CTERM motif-containing protein